MKRMISALEEQDVRRVCARFSQCSAGAAAMPVIHASAGSCGTCRSVVGLMFARLPKERAQAMLTSNLDQVGDGALDAGIAADASS